MDDPNPKQTRAALVMIFCSMMIGIHLANWLAPKSWPPFGRFMWLLFGAFATPCIVFMLVVIVLLAIDAAKSKSWSKKRRRSTADRSKS